MATQHAMRAIIGRLIRFGHKPGKLALSSATTIAYFFLKPLVKLKNRLRYKALAPDGKVLYIDVHDLVGFRHGRASLRWKVPGDVVGGDWDLHIDRRPFTSREKFVSIKQHFRQGLPWAKTQIFENRYASEIARTGFVRGRIHLDAVAEDYQKYDLMYEDIKQNGILPATKPNKVGPIYVYIGRNGEIIYTADGNHRLALAMLAGIHRIPVQILWRHQKWQELRDQVADWPADDLAAKLPDLLNHPDLEDLFSR